MKGRGSISVVLITVDCLRADHCGFMGYTRPTTPFLDELARDSLVFPNAIVTGAPTYYSFPGLLASRYPLSLGREVVGIAPGEPTVATVLQGAGYRTAALVAANPYLSARFGYDQGFELFRDFAAETSAAKVTKEDPNLEGHSGQRRFLGKLNQRLSSLAHTFASAGKLYDEAYFRYCQRIANAKHEDWDSLRRFPAAQVLVDEACSWLRTLGEQPFFLWLHFMDPHAPYYPTAEALAATGGDVGPRRARYLNESWKRADLGPGPLRKYRDEIVELYDAGIRSVDMQVARLIEFLRATSLWESCLMALTADHGEEFLEHDGIFHSPANPYQQMLQVPLLLRMPGMQKELSPAPFSQLHLAPTLLEAVGMKIPAEFEGRSYWPELQTGEGWEVAISESVAACTNPMSAAKRLAGRLAVIQNERYKLVLDFERGAEELYDLSLDPGERNCLPQGAEPKVRARMLRAVREHIERQRARSHSAIALHAMVREIGLEWSHSNHPAEILAN